MKNYKNPVKLKVHQNQTQRYHLQLITNDKKTDIDSIISFHIHRKMKYLFTFIFGI